MKKASIVSIGNELLNGHTVDTNAAYLSAQLISLGLPVVSVHLVGDDIHDIVRIFNLACGEADVILVTGGLGPTDDDLTRQAMAKFLGVELQLQSWLLDELEVFFARRNITMPAKNKIQAYIPAGAQVLPNPIGTAPGIFAKTDDKYIFVMPGVPSEMKMMFEDSISPVLSKLAGKQAIVIKKLQCFGAGESQIAEELGSLMDRNRNPLINCTVSSGVITLHIISSADDESRAQQMMEEDLRLLCGILGNLVYGFDGQTLAQVVGAKLCAEKKTIAVAESCTGGLLAKLITDVPGASDYFMSGWVTYSNQAKISQLGVPKEIIEKFGAVSEQTAESMAKGAKKIARTDYAIGITGIAGPGGGTKEKPAGLVYVSVESDAHTEVKRFIFSGDRDTIRIRAAQTALNMLRLRLGV